MMFLGMTSGMLLSANRVIQTMSHSIITNTKNAVYEV